MPFGPTNIPWSYYWIALLYIWQRVDVLWQKSHLNLLRKVLCIHFLFAILENASFIESWLVEGNQIRPCTMTNMMPSMSLSYQYWFLCGYCLRFFWPFCYAQLSAFLRTPTRLWFFLISSTCTNSYMYVRASIPSRREWKLYNNDMAEYCYDRFSIRPSIWQS